jgi:hypothetical protein
MTINPLLFMPSPRDIPQVKKQWHMLPYDKYIVKYEPQHIAYAQGKQYFLNHPQYTHFVVCADDLVILMEDMETLLEDAERFDVIDALCNIDETQPGTYAIQPLGCKLTGEKPDTSHGAWYMEGGAKPILPKGRYLQVGHSGAACRVIKRETFERLAFTGARQGLGWFDYQMSKELTTLKIPIMVDTVVKLYHMRNAETPVKVKEGSGYSFLLKE